MDPAMRRKMGTMPNPPAPTDEGGDMGGEQAAEEPAAGGDSKPTAFLPKELGGGKQWKPGDEIVLKIDAVDPETGEMQVSYAPESPDESAEPTDTMSAMDEKLPDDGDGGGY
jgi:hypothetical protein